MARILDQKCVRRITVEIYDGGLLNVREGIRHCNGLSWHEMLGQVAQMTHPKIKHGRFRMATSKEWREWKAGLIRR